MGSGHKKNIEYYIFFICITKFNPLMFHMWELTVQRMSLHFLFNNNQSKCHIVFNVVAAWHIHESAKQSERVMSQYQYRYRRDAGPVGRQVEQFRKNIILHLKLRLRRWLAIHGSAAPQTPSIAFSRLALLCSMCFLSELQQRCLAGSGLLLILRRNTNKARGNKLDNDFQSNYICRL